MNTRYLRVMKRVLILGLIFLTLIIIFYSGILCSNNIKIYVLPPPVDRIQYIIFYVESSGPNALNFRQACAVESAARHNLRTKVNVFIQSSKSINDVFSLNHSLSNINLIQTNYEDIFMGTPLEQWYKKQSWLNNNQNITKHFSELVRFLLMFKLGGIYLDTDVIVLKRLSGFKDFVIKMDDDLSITSAVFGFREMHPFSSLYLDNFVKDYDANSWSNIGSTTISGTLKDFCERHCNIHLLPSSVLFPVSSDEWSEYFDRSRTMNVLSKIRDNYMVYIFNNLGSNKKILLGSGTTLEEIMRSNCPLVYHHIARMDAFSVDQ